MNILCVGLGNPGQKYAATRHNLGRRAVEAWAAERGATPWQPAAAFAALVTTISLSETKKIICLLPEVSMNGIGDVVARAAVEFNVAPPAIVLVHDELELPFGDVTLQQGGSAHGHNGVRSIHAALQSQDSPRVRLGIGREGAGSTVSDFVLQPFTPQEAQHVPTMLTQAVALLEQITSERQSPE
jgi:PTH1 family peptidyl-tRNA hydrolase